MEITPASTLDVGSAGQRRLIAVAECLLCSDLPTQLLLQGMWWQTGRPFETMPGHPALPFVVTVQLADTVLLIVLMVILTRAHGETVSGLWLGQRPRVKEAFLGLALVPVVFMLVVLLLNGIQQYAPWLHNVSSNPLEELAGGGRVNAVLFGIVVIFAGGLREELQRAFLLRRFERHLGGAAVGVVVLSALFGAGHFLQGKDAMIATGTLGVFWSVLYLKRRSSIAPVVSHAGFNSLEVLRVVIAGRV
jgi:membrane protease YdiL (CAAX protease family)